MKKIIVLMVVSLAIFASPAFSQTADDNKQAAADLSADQKSLKDRVAELEAQNRDLDAKVDDLEDRVTDIEDKLSAS